MKKGNKPVKKQLAKPKVRKGDEIVVITGKDKGRRGKVISVNSKEHTCIVEKINEYKKNQKPSQKNPQGGIITVAMPLQLSNVMVVDKTTSKPTRVGRKEVSGKHLRYAKVSGQLIDSE